MNTPQAPDRLARKKGLSGAALRLARTLGIEVYDENDVRFIGYSTLDDGECEELFAISEFKLDLDGVAYTVRGRIGEVYGAWKNSKYYSATGWDFEILDNDGNVVADCRNPHGTIWYSDEANLDAIHHQCVEAIFRRKDKE